MTLQNNTSENKTEEKSKLSISQKQVKPLKLPNSCSSIKQGTREVKKKANKKKHRSNEGEETADNKIEIKRESLNGSHGGETTRQEERVSNLRSRKTPSPLQIGNSQRHLEKTRPAQWGATTWKIGGIAPLRQTDTTK
ncbi:hypothetical protein JTE90_028794 [Oedothorax gibbosus]|uniref:Uncharacterized protein n=1 Tax=Oedothorax gibbosus TaxID=931172 RepID=A0AAV6VYD7_9ARAC|nr:hypothetical protein JTE90_028794 [Oedothorax gibbosus]